MGVGSGSSMFAVIADSHFRVRGDDPQAAYPSDAGHNDRNRRVVEVLQVVSPDHVVHLGDVPHPVPGLTAHAVALAIARETYAPLGETRLTVVPGNHDVGDKPRPWANAPGVGANSHAVFEQTWGAPYGSFDHAGLHLVWIDTPVLNSGLSLEAEQWAWLEQDLAAHEGGRIFAFVHYPPFLADPHEAEHYDNLAEPARSRLLGLLEAHGVEALFAGHVHNAFYDRLGELDLHVVPSTAFVRPEYAELADVGPAGEFGRDDPAKLGLLLVHVDDGGYGLEVVRTEDPLLSRLADRHPALLPGTGPSPPSPLGAELRHDWSLPREVPYGNLDEFTRKVARNDHLVVALWDLGLDRLRVPLADLRDARRLARMEALAARGTRFIVFSAGPPGAAEAALVAANLPLLAGWEVVVVAGHLEAAGAALEDLPLRLPRWLSRAGGASARDGAYFSHFPEHGFVPGDALGPWSAFGRTFRIAPRVRPTEALAAVRGLGLPALCRLQLPREGEGRAFTDDRRIALRIAEATVAAWATPGAEVVVDTLVDHDRGYHPRHGLLDRRCNPRPAYHVLRHLGRLLAGVEGPLEVVDRPGERCLVVGGLGTVYLPETASRVGPGALDLVSGARLGEGGSCAWPWLEVSA